MVDFSLLFHIPYFQQQQYPQQTALAARDGQGWKRYSTEQLVVMINQLSRGLIEADVQPGEHVAIISPNRPEWILTDLAIQQVQAVVVPVFPELDPQEMEHILDDASISVAFVSNEEVLSKIKNNPSEGSLKRIYSFDKMEEVPHWEELLLEDVHEEELENRKTSVSEDDIATIVYTSGTTGKPKGVMLTHRNFVTNVKARKKLMPVRDGHKALSFLPLNHMFERILTYVNMSTGLGIYYAESIDKIADNLKEIQPQTFTTVPRLLEKVYEKIIKVGEQQRLVKKLIFRAALRLTEQYEVQGKGWLYRSVLHIADQLVYRQWRQALGNHIIAVISGGATLNPRICRFFTAARMPILEGYGLTETSPVISVNHYEKEYRKIGTVGPAIENVEVKVAEDGEILCKGPNIMKGYLKREKETQETIDEQGWLHTGDIGRIDSQGFLIITDRKKSMIKTSTGKYVAPQVVEKKMKESFFIANLMVVGEGRKMITALVVPDFDNLKAWCQEQAIEWESKASVIQHPKVRKHYDREIDQ